MSCCKEYPPSHLSSVYGLVDPLSNQLHYIGCSINPESRLSVHVSSSKEGGHVSEKEKWILSLKGKGLKPDLFIVETVCDDCKVERELFWIEYYKTIGTELFNVIGIKKRARSRYPEIVTNDSFNSTMVFSLRKSTRLTQEEFAREIGCSTSMISKWETNKPVSIKSRFMRRLAKLHKKAFKGEAK